MFRRALLHTTIPRSAAGARSIYNATAAHRRSLLRTRPSCTRARPDAEEELGPGPQRNAEAAGATDTERAIVNIVKATGWGVLSTISISLSICWIGIIVKFVG